MIGPRRVIPTQQQQTATKTLETQFDAAMMGVYRRAWDEAGYRASLYHQMLVQHRGLKTAQILLRATKLSDTINYWLYQTMQQQMELSERPWIGVSDVEPLTNYRVGGRPSTHIEVKNYRKGPALNVVVKSAIFIGPPHTFVFSKVSGAHENILGSAFPGHGGVWIPKLSIPLPQGAVTTNANAPNAPELIVFGLVTYEDRLGLQHHTPICMRYHPETPGFLEDGSCATDSTIPKID